MHERRPVQSRFVVEGTGKDSAFVREQIKIVYRFDPGTVIYPIRKGPFQLDTVAFADRLTEGSRIAGLTPFELRNPVTGVLLTHQRHITLRPRTRFGAYADKGHKQTLKK